MGDGEKTPLKLNFDCKVRLEFRGVIPFANNKTTKNLAAV